MGLTTRVAWHIRSLLDIRQSDELHVRVGLERGLEALQRGVDRATQRRRGHQLDVGVAGEGIAQLAALLVAEICEEGVGDDMVGGGEIVDALGELVVSSILEGNLPTRFFRCLHERSAQRAYGDWRWRADVPGRGGHSG